MKPSIAKEIRRMANRGGETVKIRIMGRGNHAIVTDDPSIIDRAIGRKFFEWERDGLNAHRARFRTIAQTDHFLIY